MDSLGYSRNNLCRAVRPAEEIIPIPWPNLQQRVPTMRPFEPQLTGQYCPWCIRTQNPFSTGCSSTEYILQLKFHNPLSCLGLSNETYCRMLSNCCLKACCWKNYRACTYLNRCTRENNAPQAYRGWLTQRISNPLRTIWLMYGPVITCYTFLRGSERLTHSYLSLKNAL